MRLIVSSLPLVAMRIIDQGPPAFPHWKAVITPVCLISSFSRLNSPKSFSFSSQAGLSQFLTALCSPLCCLQFQLRSLSCEVLAVSSSWCDL